jgi:hypothetical protein
MVRGILAKQEEDKEGLEKALSHARKSGGWPAVWHGWNGAKYKYVHGYVPRSDEGYKALRLARAVRHFCLADAYDATPEEFVKEAALQLELLLSDMDNGVDWGSIHSSWGSWSISGYVHHCVATLTLFLKMVSSEALIAVAADACVKVVEYLGKVEYTCNDLDPESDMKEEIDAISSLCERIIERADAPVVDPVDDKRKAPKRNREEYEEQF